MMPSMVYDLIGALLLGEQAVVVGKYTPGNYWIINNLDAAGTCWLWGQYATVTGNIYANPLPTCRPGQLHGQQDLHPSCPSEFQLPICAAMDR